MRYSRKNLALLTQRVLCNLLKVFSLESRQNEGLVSFLEGCLMGVEAASRRRSSRGPSANVARVNRWLVSISCAI